MMLDQAAASHILQPLSPLPNGFKASHTKWGIKPIWISQCPLGWTSLCDARTVPKLTLNFSQIDIGVFFYQLEPIAV
jgi:hypothetical protein